MARRPAIGPPLLVVGFNSIRWIYKGFWMCESLGVRFLGCEVFLHLCIVRRRRGNSIKTKDGLEAQWPYRTIIMLW